MIDFEAPYFLWLLLPLFPLGSIVFRRRRQGGAAVQFSSLSLFDPSMPGGALRWRALLPVLRLCALALLILALARPRFGTVERDVTREGVDIFYCLDISGSMRAEDFKPTRLAKAKELTAAFAEKRNTDRQGIVLFAGASFALCPLTFDNGTVREFLESITFDDVGAQGTAIGDGLARSLKKLTKSKAKSRVVILMTDGENNAGDISPEQAVALAREMNVRVYTIGIGSHGEALATFPTEDGRFQRTRIRTSIDEELLRKIASETGGIYRRATNERELRAVLDEIDSLETTEIEMKEYRHYDERMAILCWAALALLLFELTLANTRLLKIP